MKGLVFIALALLPFGAWAQKPVIEFETTSHNFGTIGEKGGKVAYDFVFRNTGDSPLLIRRVQAGCGCTSTDWPRQPILPQRTDTIRVYFDPIGRPGKFIKCITVNSNSTTPVVSLTVRGMVRGEAAGPYDSYHCRLGDLYLEIHRVCQCGRHPVPHHDFPPAALPPCRYRAPNCRTGREEAPPYHV